MPRRRSALRQRYSTHSAAGGVAATTAPPPPPSAQAYESMRAFDYMVHVRPSLKPYLLEIGLDTAAQLAALREQVAIGNFWNMEEALQELEIAMRRDYRPLTRRPRRGRV